MALTCKEMIQKHPQAWQEATIHPFLEQCQLGTIKQEQFNTWLVQDYLFVIELTRMTARVLTNAPVRDFDVILAGLNSLKNELNWFREKAVERNLDLDAHRQDSCMEYCTYLYSLNGMPYALQATALWAIESVYNQAWQLPGKMPPPYQEFAQRWGNPGFSEYVESLAEKADVALEMSSENIQNQAEKVFLNIARLEKDFWQMAFNAD